jgi:hypothetical protein
MWEIVGTGLIVGIALFFTGQSIVRRIRDQDRCNCGSGCHSCPYANHRVVIDKEKGKEVQRELT